MPSHYSERGTWHLGPSALDGYRPEKRRQPLANCHHGDARDVHGSARNRPRERVPFPAKSLNAELRAVTAQKGGASVRWAHRREVPGGTALLR
jgi:hypothetical protein